MTERNVYSSGQDGLPDERLFIKAEGEIELILDSTGFTGQGFILISAKPFSFRYEVDGEWEHASQIEEDVARWTFAEGLKNLQGMEEE